MIVTNLITTKTELCNFLGIPVETLNFFLYGLSDSQRYIHFHIKKRNGSTRLISAPTKKLKDIQKLVLDKILTPAYIPPPNAFAYILERGIRENADVHVSNLWLLKVDLKDFFPSINFGRVYGLFKKSPFKFNHQVATVLAQICCVNNSLPQGAPTSPIISNLICKKLDSKLNSIAVNQRCHYTRYADDIIFSTNRSKFPKALAQYDSDNEFSLSEQLETLIHNEGFVINNQKVKLSGSDQRKLVTGIIVNKKTNVQREYYRDLRSALYCWKTKGYEVASQIFFEKFDHKNRPPGKEKPAFAEVLQGKINHIGYVKGYGDRIFQKLSKELAALDSNYIHKESMSIRYGKQPINFRLICEGKTDLELIKAAQEHFNNKGRFRNFDIHYDFKSSDKGDSDLKKMSEILSRGDQPLLTILLFDRDQSSIIKEMGGESGFIKKSHNLYTAVLPTPPHRKDDDLFCIEMLFDDETIKTSTEEGFRLFFKSEFDPDNGCHQSEEYVLLTPKKNSLIIDDGVTDVKAKRNIALSKKKFSSLILNKSKPFSEVNFSGFESLFNLLIRIHHHSTLSDK